MVGKPYNQLNQPYL